MKYIVSCHGSIQLSQRGEVWVWAESVRSNLVTKSAMCMCKEIVDMVSCPFLPSWPGKLTWVTRSLHSPSGRQTYRYTLNMQGLILGGIWRASFFFFLLQRLLSLRWVGSEHRPLLLPILEKPLSGQCGLCQGFLL